MVLEFVVLMLEKMSPPPSSASSVDQASAADDSLIFGLMGRLHATLRFAPKASPSLSSVSLAEPASAS
jgi:hypothetical protein